MQSILTLSRRYHSLSNSKNSELLATVCRLHNTSNNMAFVPSVSLNCRSIWTSKSQTRNLCSSRSSPSYLQTEEAHISQHAINWRSSTPSPTSSSPTPNSTTRAQLLDGKSTAALIRSELAVKVTEQISKYSESARPSLAVVLVGTRPDSMSYVRSKRRVCTEIGIRSESLELPEEIMESDLQKIVKALNDRDGIDGILVQLPLPKHINEENILNLISMHKDVDGFHPLNIGRLCMSGRTPPLFIPCTPRACIELLDRYNIEIQGKNAVVIGRSNIVGLPVAMLLMHRNATVTICHSKTKDTQDKIKNADIVVAACGMAGFVKGAWLKEGAVVIDVGINAVDDDSKKRGYRLVGDVDFNNAVDVVDWITPVPGGVGPMTIAMLMQNTYEASARRVGSVSAIDADATRVEES